MKNKPKYDHRVSFMIAEWRPDGSVTLDVFGGPELAEVNLQMVAETYPDKVFALYAGWDGNYEPVLIGYGGKVFEKRN